MTDTKQTHGGARKGAGRLPVADKAKTRTIRMTDEQYKKFKSLGGVKWLKSLIDTSKEGD